MSVESVSEWARRARRGSPRASRQPVPLESEPAAAPASMLPRPLPWRVCTTCGSVDCVKTHTPGNIIFEVGLWLRVLLPGFVYSMWRRNGRKTVCGACGSATLVGALTPTGRRTLADKARTASGHPRVVH